MLFAGLDEQPFHFVHSYAARRFPLLDDAARRHPAERSRRRLGRHDEPFVAAVENGPLTGPQLRPGALGRRGSHSPDPLGRFPESGEQPMTDRLELLPAVDVADGQAVRLTQGAAGTETGYGDPLMAALDWYAGGAEWIHLVDLDAAFGRGSNASLLAEVTAELSGKGVKVELSGGIRDDASVERALATGATRMNLGTAALENPEWTARVIDAYGDKIAVGLDVRGTTLAARGWTRGRRRPVGGARAPRGRRLRALRRHRRDEGRHAQRPERRAARSRCAPRRTHRSSPRAASRASRTSASCARSCRSASRARSSARRCTRAPSRLPEALDVAGRP